MAAFGESFLSGFAERKKQKRITFFKNEPEKAENKGSEVENEPERTGKRSGEVVENTLLRKKRTENEPENTASGMVGNIRWSKNQPELFYPVLGRKRHSLRAG
jgi:hypothetical protein